MTSYNAGQHFDFLYVIPGIAIGLGVARTCEFLGHVVVYDKFHTMSWLHLALAIGLLAYAAQYWYYATRVKEASYIKNYFHYLIVIIMPMIIFLLSVIVCPSQSEKGFDDLRAHFEASRPLLFTLVGLSLYASAAESLIVDSGNTLAYPNENLARIIIGSLFILLTMTGMANNDGPVVGLIVLAGAFRIATAKYPI